MHKEDRDLYAEAKLQAKHGVDTAQAYNQNKQAVVRAIYTRILKLSIYTSQIDSLQWIGDSSWRKLCPRKLAPLPAGMGTSLRFKRTP
jgi:hypothetical protein